MTLAMTHAGARGDTEQQMAQALRYQLPQSELHEGFNWLDLELERRGPNTGQSAFRLFIANAVFSQTGYTFLPSYLNVLARNYGAGISLLDFISDAEGARKDINNWVSRITDENIPELLAPGTLTTDTRLVLTNAVYFKARWKTPFNEQATSSGTFHAPGGDVTVPMMRGMPGSMRYAEGDGYQAVSLPYKGDEFDMVIILPAAGDFAAVESSLDVATVRDLLARLCPGDYGAVVLPKFEFRFQAQLEQALASLGMTAAFDPDVADFSGMDGSRNLFISSVAHEAFINVDEFGTEAAAATAAVVGVTSAPRTLVIDRPFVFLIRDVETNAIIFLGRVTDPSR